MYVCKYIYLIVGLNIAYITRVILSPVSVFAQIFYILFSYLSFSCCSPTKIIKCRRAFSTNPKNEYKFVGFDFILKINEICCCFHLSTHC